MGFGAAISACEKCGEWEWPLVLLNDMQTWGLSGDEVCINAAMSGCGKQEQWEAALSFVRFLDKHFELSEGSHQQRKLQCCHQRMREEQAMAESHGVALCNA